LPKLENRGSTVSLLCPSMEKVGQKTLNPTPLAGKNPFFLTAFGGEFYSLFQNLVRAASVLNGLPLQRRRGK